MARIRSIRPEFWDDELMGKISRDARLLYIATWNMADDEGRLRWSAAYLKANAFMYDLDLDLPAVTKLMKELAGAGRILPYQTCGQWYGHIAHFKEYQKPNRPLPSKIPAPPLSPPEVLSESSVSPHGALTPVVVVVEESRGEERRGELVSAFGVNGSASRATRKSTTDDRVRAGLDLAAKLQREGR